MVYGGQPKKIAPMDFKNFDLDLCNLNFGWNKVIALELESNSNLKFCLGIKNIESYLIENIVPKIKENMVSEYYKYYRNGKKIQNFYDPISFFKGVVLFNDKKIPFEFHETINQNKGEIIFFNDGEEIFFNNLIYKKIDDKDMSNDKEWDGFIEVLSDYGIVLSSQFYFSGSSMIKSGFIDYNNINWKISSERSKNKNGYIFEIKTWCNVYHGRRNFIFNKQVLEDEINFEDTKLKCCEKISLNYKSEGFISRYDYEYIDIITIENWYTNIDEVKKGKIPQKIILCFEQTKKDSEEALDSNEIIKFEFYNYKEDLYNLHFCKFVILLCKKGCLVQAKWFPLSFSYIHLSYYNKFGTKARLIAGLSSIFF